MKRLMMIGFMIAVSAVHGGTVCSSESAPFRLDLRTGVRESSGSETLTYSSLWDGGDGATVTIAQNGAALVDSLTGEGDRPWSVTRNGTYVLTHTTYTNGVAGKVETATFVVTGRDVPFSAADVTVADYARTYDGAAHGIGVTVASGIAGAAVKYATAANVEFAATAPTLTDVGSMTVWCEIAAPGYITQTNSATITITKRAVTLTSGSDSKAYDGTALTKHEVTVGGDGFAAGEGASYEYTGSQMNVGTSENAFTYVLNEGTKAGNYDISTSNGTLTVTKATVGPGGGGGDEPGAGEVPQGGISKFDATFVYDGEGHTIDTNALVAAFGNAMIGERVVKYAFDDGSGGSGVRGAPALPWGAVPVYTNVGEYVVWYRVTNPNYDDFVHAAKLAITNRPVTVASGNGSWTYDGQAHANATVATEGFVEGEGLEVGNFATITDVGSVANAFDFVFADGTLASNYVVTCVTGTLTVTSARMDDWKDETKWSVTLSGNCSKYDGTAKTCTVTAISYDGFAIPTFTVSGNTATDAGDYTLTVTGVGNFSGSHTFPWSIAKRAVTLTSGSASKVYDGTALTNHVMTVGGDGFVVGEGASYSYTGSQTDVGISENSFTYALKANTKAGNYEITTANGTLRVFKPAEIRNVTAKQRYPWNGKVDVCFEIDGEENMEGLVAHWPLDGNILDVSGNGHDLVQAGNAMATSAPDRSGLANSAYSFDGTALLPLNYEDSLIVTDNFTLAVWFKTAVPMSSHGNSRTNWNPGNDIIHAGFGDYVGVGVGLRVGTDGIAVVEHGSFYRPTVFTYKCDIGEEWHHLAVTVDDNGGEIVYLDGQYVGTAEINDGCLTAIHGNGRKGAFMGDGIGGGQWGHYTGLLDDVRIYNRALSGSEIAMLYRSGSTAATDCSYSVSLVAKDLVGGTNLPMRTVHKMDGTAVNLAGESVVPGTYRWIWDAGTDLPDGWKNDQVAVAVDAEYRIGTSAGLATSIENITATTGAFGLSLKHDGIRESSGNEMLTYSSLWDGGDGATVTIAQDGVALVEGLIGEGDRSWSVTRNGTYVLTHTTYTNGVAGKVETATFVVTGKDVPFSTADVTVADYVGTYDGAAHGIGVTVASGIAGAVVKYATAANGEFAVAAPMLTDVGSMTVWCEIAAPGYTTQTNSATITITKRTVTLTSGSASKAYDGTPLTKHTVTASGDGFVLGEGATYSYTGIQTEVGSSVNNFSYTLKSNTKAGNYTITKSNGTLTVTKATIGGGGGNDEPGDGTVPAGGLSKFDTTAKYDGEGHTIDTEALVAAFSAAVPGDFAVAYALDDGSGESGHAGRVTLPWLAEAPVYTNAGEYVVWYRVSHPNYEDFIHAAKVKITPRNVTFTSGSASKTYDGVALTKHTVTAGGDGFVSSEGVIYSYTGIQTDVGSSANNFSYTLKSNTKAGNYTIMTVPGTLTVTKRPVTVTVTGHTATHTYDGTEKTLDVFDLATKDELYDVDKNTYFAGIGYLARRTDVGTSYMDLNAGQFANVDANFDVTYVVTPGWVKIVPRDISGDGGSADFTITLGANPKYNGTVQTIAVNAVTCGGLPVTYTLAGENATHAGTYTLTVKATGNFSGERSTTWQVLKRAVKLTSGSASKVYDGSPLANPNVTIGGDGFIGIEGATFEVTGSQTVAGTSKNVFGYTLKAGTLAGDYDIVKVAGDLVVTPATLNPADVFGGEGTGENPLVCEKTYNGAAQPVEIVPNFDEPYQFLWALTEGNENAYFATPPTLRNVADDDLEVYFKFVSANFQPYYGKVVFRIVPKQLMNEMVVLTDEAFFYDPDSGQKTPSVTVADTNAVGVVISTAADYDIAYGDSTSAGAVPVIVTAKNNYTGTVTKTFPILKRPVAPPVIGAKAYNGRTQKATVTTDERWTVVRNNGGINVGEYEVVLRLTNGDDYCWKGIDAEESDWTGVFRITKANNGWSRKPGITGWTYGETPNEPVMGQARYGTVQVAYRRKGADVSAETPTKPSTPGTYIARFWVDETESYIGVALSVPYEVEFTIAPGAGGFTETQTTPVPVPYVWLDPYLAKYGEGDYEAAGHATGANGYALWESYVAGLDPEDPTSKFTAFIEMLPGNTPKVTWSPDLSNAEKPRKYTVLGKATLLDADWTPVTDANKPQMRFFKVKVEMR